MSEHEEPIERVNKRDAVAGISLLGLLAFGLCGTIVYRIVDREAPGPAGAPTVVVSAPPDPLIVAKPIEDAQVAPAGATSENPAVEESRPRFVAPGDGGSSEAR